MNWIWLLPALLVASLAMVLHPLFLRRGGDSLPAGIEGNPRAELEDQRDLLLRQLKELDLDLKAGTVTPDDGVTLKNEIQGELALALGALDALPAAKAPLTMMGVRRPLDMAAGVILALLIAALAGGLYLVMGTPVPPQQAASPHHTAQSAPDVELMVQRLAERLQQNPGDLPGWLRLGRAYAVMERPREAIEAFLHVLELQPRNIEAASGIAEIQIQSDDPASFSAGVQLFRDILAEDPRHKQARWILGLVAYRAGDGVQALEMWEALLQTIPAGSAEYTTVESAVADARALVAAAPH